MKRLNPNLKTKKNNMNYLNHWIQIKSFKHDGVFHRFWDRGLVVLDDDDFIVVASKCSKVVETNGRKWFTKEPAVTVFSKKKWYNVICMFKNDGIAYYCNIASPCIVEKNTIKYIDYDLDIKMNEKGNIKILDEKEYQSHRKTYEYSADLDKVLKLELNDVKAMMENKCFPFDDEKIRQLYNDYLKNVDKRDENKL